MTMNHPSIRPKFAIFCDDIRREISGKDILIGVYGGDIRVPSLPISVILAVWMAFEKEGVGKLSIEFRALGPDGEPLGYGSTTVDIIDDDTSDGTFRFPGLSTVLRKSGEITFQIKQHDEPWQTVRKIPVKVIPLRS
ncbi:MAG: DUF6941 family protein [Stellaceae bacterium]